MPAAIGPGSSTPSCHSEPESRGTWIAMPTFVPRPTFAPEAGTQRLRDAVNKNVTELDLLAAIDAAIGAGWRRIKLYFMVGLPTETDEDVTAIGDLVEKAILLAKNRKRPLSIKVAVSSFVPKPHTPFQWRGQDTKEELDVQTRRWVEIVEQNEGKDLNDPEWADGLASDYEGHVFPPFLGGMTYLCHIWPILRVPERQEEMVSIIREYEDCLDTIPGTPLKVWGITGLGGIRQPFLFQTELWKIDPANAEAQEKIWECRKKAFELVADKGGCSYRQGKTDHRSALLKRARPEYTKVLMAIKQALDPNNIMNPGGLINI